MSTLDMVREEIEGLHIFFVGWFGGALPESAFDDGFMARFDSDSILIPPAGNTLGIDALAAAVKGGYNTNPEFRIAIRNVVVRREFPGYILATYEEWQRNALATSPPDNARAATVLFSYTDRLRWLHIHETTLPADVVAAGDFTF